MVKPHGLRGEVLVRVLSDRPDRFAAGASLLVGRTPESARPLEVDGHRSHQGRLLLHFAGVDGVDAAQLLRDQLLFVPDGPRQELVEGEYWADELIGAVVEHRNGSELGRLKDVLARPAQDLWTIETPSGEVLFPAARQLVVAIDVEAGRIVIDPPEGLFP